MIWDAATGDKVSELKGHSSYVNSVAWSPKGPLQVPDMGKSRAGGKAGSHRTQCPVGLCSRGRE